jgi:hypothetical protein
MSSEIKVDTISEQTSANGVAIDSLGIKDGKITNLMNATLSAADLGSGVHIKTADTSGSVSTNADELVIEGTRSGMTFLAANDNFSYINFGDDGGADRGTIRYGHSADSFSFQTAATEAMVIDSIGAVTKPLQPAFLVQPSLDQTNIDTSNWVTLALGSERFDQNADFASNVFTAPVTGRYFLNCYVRLNSVDEAADYYWIKLVTSNRTIYGTLFDLDYLSADPNYWALNVAALADMDANDTVTVEIRQTNGTQQTDIDGTSSHFSGFLAC